MRIDLPEQKKLNFEMTIPIRWGDMDAMGHVNNTIYFRYLEIVRIEWMQSLGFGMQKDREGFVIVNVQTPTESASNRTINVIEQIEGIFKKAPDRDQFGADIKEALIVELYSR